jgi:shikimate dehydrogenase
VSQRWACLIGQPVKHSLSPALHNAAFAACDLDMRYDLCEVAAADLGSLMPRLTDPSCIGANVTAPHKAAVVPYMVEVSDEARTLGVVNTIVNREGRLMGDNTDAAGLQAWMEASGIHPAGGDTLVLGAGGAARATVLALSRLGARSIRVLNRTPERAAALVQELHVDGTWGRLDEAARSPGRPAAVVVNATSLGHHGGGPTVDPGWYSPETVAVELVYNPPETHFMRDARAAGARAENGLGMLIHQAMLSFERWVGVPAPFEVFEAAARHEIDQRRKGA